MNPANLIERLRGSVRGQVMTPADSGYDEARKLFNGMIERRPAAIAQCRDAADVVACVRLAREHRVTAAVRGGGHSVAGKSMVDGGLVIDLSLMKRVEVDPATRTARAEPGVRLGELDKATHAHGLATPLGIASDTGIAGLTLGGGIGWVNGKYGLTCDNVLEFEVATADGELRRTNERRDPDLYWALRGGGGNFGVVTEFTYRLHPVSTVVGGMVLFAFEDARQVLRAYREFAAKSPDELTTAAAIVPTPDGGTVLAIAVCWCGEVSEGERAMEPIRGFGTPLAWQIGPLPFTAMQSLLDAAFPPGNRHYWKAGFVQISDDVIDTVVDYSARRPSPLTISYLFHVHGAAARVPGEATAFAHRADQFDFMTLSQWTDPAADGENIAWARSFFQAMGPLLGDGVYSNGLGDDAEERVLSAFGRNYRRLAEIKSKYDPTNFFHLNANIKPLTKAAGED